MNQKLSRTSSRSPELGSTYVAGILDQKPSFKRVSLGHQSHPPLGTAPRNLRRNGPQTHRGRASPPRPGLTPDTVHAKQARYIQDYVQQSLHGGDEVEVDLDQPLQDDAAPQARCTGERDDDGPGPHRPRWQDDYTAARESLPRSTTHHDVTTTAKRQPAHKV